MVVEADTHFTLVGVPIVQLPAGGEHSVTHIAGVIKSFIEVLYSGISELRNMCSSWHMEDKSTAKKNKKNKKKNKKTKTKTKKRK